MIQGQAGYSEETPFNPSTFQATVILKGLTPASQAMANNGINEALLRSHPILRAI